MIPDSGDHMEAYTLGIIGVLALCLVSILLAIHSGYSKGRAGALSGPVLPPDDGKLLFFVTGWAAIY
jgi:hypothetical protein